MVDHGLFFDCATVFVHSPINIVAQLRSGSSRIRIGLPRCCVVGGRISHVHGHVHGIASALYNNIWGRYLSSRMAIVQGVAVCILYCTRVGELGLHIGGMLF